MSSNDGVLHFNLKYFKVTYPAEYVALVEINRPEKLNAFNDDMWTQLRDVFTALSTASSIRAIVLTGAGPKAFTAGLDVSGSSPATADLPSDAARQAFHWRHHIHHLQSTVSSLAACLKPIICALHGYSYGAAIDLATACDVRLASANTRFSVRETAIGVAADVGTLSRLPKCVPNLSWVKEVCLTAREFGAREAERVGFVSQAVEGGRDGVVERAVEMAGEMGKLSPVAVQGTKRVIDYSVEHSVADGLEYVSVWNSAMVQGEDFPKAMGSGLRREKVSFAKL